MKSIEINGETIYLRKSKFFGWKVVKPIKENGKINWKNFLIGGSWINLGITIFVILLILGVVSEYSMAIKLLNECLISSKPLIPY